jgi:hypothetical protein
VNPADDALLRRKQEVVVSARITAVAPKAPRVTKKALADAAREARAAKKADAEAAVEAKRIEKERKASMTGFGALEGLRESDARKKAAARALIPVQPPVPPPIPKFLVQARARKAAEQAAAAKVEETPSEIVAPPVEKESGIPDLSALAQMDLSVFNDPKPDAPVKAAVAKPESAEDTGRPFDNNQIEPLAVIIDGTAEGSDPAHRKAYLDFRDRAAYVFVTGAFPTHLRPESVRLLRNITQFSKTQDAEMGSVRILPKFVEDLDLTNHPMVREVRRYQAKGWIVSVSPHPDARRPFGRVWIYKPLDETRAMKGTVFLSGATKNDFV